MDEEETVEMSGDEEYSDQGAMMMATVIHKALENKKKVNTRMYLIQPRSHAIHS